jgi:hypothetical protein
MISFVNQGKVCDHLLELVITQMKKMKIIKWVSLSMSADAHQFLVVRYLYIRF